jgi:hypothetical protein
MNTRVSTSMIVSRVPGVNDRDSAETPAEGKRNKHGRRDQHP